jgi:BMFP domain-containing protein YqiC
MEVQLRLTIRILNSRIEQLEAELSMLKRCVAQTLLESPPPKLRRTMSAQTREKLEYYHQRKDAVIQQLSEKHGLPPDSFSWTCVKKYTDHQKQMER